MVDDICLQAVIWSDLIDFAYACVHFIKIEFVWPKRERGHWLRVRARDQPSLNCGLFAEFKLPQATLLFEACGPGAQPWFGDSRVFKFNTLEQ